MPDLAGRLFTEANGHEVYRGYVDDPRNTDNAWMETVAMHFHCSPELGKMLALHAGDDAADYKKLYASHKMMIDMIDLDHCRA
ncbi:hypothetical protein EMIHUDRAFT_229143 [Emiliania huxleyi CCMP1516]|uniref:Uncharacterized protein n=2 Tax=Emiliania huxleyi TaxID=2903 RepID=A0A0D3KDL3_EMIH1|nr:hypothetical protein EMIHUDRAFT_229143 [Emiliania huxleyi CCMP1516]EOD33848.1 hypothetical protein EMIHUDRAFT_229143 [Emiliania huxleyi CCMP1516]|eukprot:XP_005786277.1 hypothetical protein EMIHUDRAFT_229143 [Emiliania huxleyi CCMP1516]